MPEADKFSTFGLFNGFPFCSIRKLDVSSYEYVAPLTLDQVSQIYYNLYSIKMGAFSANGTNLKTLLDENGRTWPFELIPPVDRVCDDGSDSFSWFYILDVDASAGISISSFVAMYDGNPDPEENEPRGEFLGYGFPMGFIQLAVGVVGLAANMQVYGSFAQDNNYTLADSEFGYPTWWGEGSWNFGGVILEAADPTSVEEVDIPTFTTQIGAQQVVTPLIRAEWAGMEQYWQQGQSWVVDPITELEFYTYP